MNRQTLLIESIPHGRTLPSQAQTRSGVIFDPRLDLWDFREGLTNIHIGFNGWGLDGASLKPGFKLTLSWLLLNLSPKHVMNMFSRSKQFFLYLIALMASPNSPTRGHPKFPQAAHPDYDVCGWMAKRAAASLSL